MKYKEYLTESKNDNMKAIKALDMLDKSFKDLMEVISSAEGDVAEFMNDVSGYPFDKSFDELATDIFPWVKKAKLHIKKIK